MSFIGCLSSCLKIFKVSVDVVPYHHITALLYRLSSLEFLELRFVSGALDPPDILLNLICASAQSPLFLPCLQTLEFVCRYSFPFEDLPRIFAPGHWQSLRVNIDIRFPFLHDIYRAANLLELVHKGFDLSIVGDGEIDLLHKYKEHSMTHN